MKNTIWLVGLMIILGVSLTGCGPAELPTASFAGTWTTNLGSVNFTQNGTEVTGNIEGYGGFWNETFVGNINDKGEAVFETEILGSFTLSMDGETFKTVSEGLSLCGIRGVDMELPTGCGFSGKWITTSRFPNVDKGHIILTQIGATVTGDFYNATGDKIETFTGEMEWGKGWRANGVTLRRGDLSLWMNSAETGFELMYGESGNPQQLCAVREGVESAYLGSYDCKP